MRAHFDVLSSNLVMHPHHASDIDGLETLLQGFQGEINASTGTEETPIVPPVVEISCYWLITSRGYILLGETATIFEAGDMLIFTLETLSYSRLHPAGQNTRIIQTISENTVISAAVSAGEKLKSFSIKNNSEGSISLKAGTSEGGTDIFEEVIEGSGLVSMDLGSLYSVSEDQDIYIWSDIWNEVTLDIVLIKEQIF